MATVTLVVTSNTDGSMTATTAAAPAQTVTSVSLTEIQTVIRGWIQQGLGGIDLADGRFAVRRSACARPRRS